MLAVQPDNVLARAEIARVYLMPGELRTSRQEFEAVSSAGDLPPAARNTVERYLTAFRVTREEGADFKGFLAVTVGWDSNVNAASNMSSVAIPGAGGASLSFPLTDSLRVNAGLAYKTQIPGDCINGH